MRRPRIEEAWRSGGHTRRVELGPFDVYPFNVAAAAVTADGHLLIAVDFFRREPRLRRLLVFARRPGPPAARHPCARAPEHLDRDGRGPRALGPRSVATSDGGRALALRPVDGRGRVGPPRTLSAGGVPIGTVMAIASSGAGAIGVHVFHGTSARRRDTLVAWRLRPGGRAEMRRTVSLRGSSVGGALAATFDGRVAWYQGGSSYAALVR